MLARLLSRLRSPRPVAQSEFMCKQCGKLAARLQLLGDAASGCRLRRESFTSNLTDPISAEDFEAFRALIAGGSARELYALDLELASFYCPKCDASYCGEHWKSWNVFDDEGFHDCIRGVCPQGHERMLED